MARLTNARNNHVARWVLPAASRILIDAARRGARTKRLDEVANIEMGQSPPGDSCNHEGDGLPLIGGPADLGLVYPQTSRCTNAPSKTCKPGDIIVCVRATIGEPRWADGIYCLGRGVAGIRSTDRNLDNRFLFRIIEGSEDSLREQGTGTTFKTISQKHLAAIQVPLVPLNEQEAISTFIEWLDKNSAGRLDFRQAPSLPEVLGDERRTIERIEGLSASIEQARELRNEAVQETEALTVAFLNSTLDSELLSQKWPLQLLPDVATIARGKFAHRPRNEPRFFGGDFPFIQIGDISNSNRYIRKYSQSLNEMGLAISRLFPAGTVVIAITGATIGVTGILTFDSCFPDSIVGVQAKPEFVTPEFIYFAVEHAKKAALAEATQTTQPNINLGNLERLQVRVPPLHEQRRIVAYLDDLQERTDNLRALQAETSAELDALMPSILDKAFRGEL